MVKDNEVIFVVIGAPRSGKTEIFKTISPKPPLRLNGISYFSINTRIEKLPFITKISIYVLPSDERFKDKRREYYEKADVAILAFNMSRRETFEKLPDLLNELFSVKQKLPIAVVGWVGFAEDRFSAHEVSMIEAQKLAEQIALKTGYHIPFKKIEALDKNKILKLLHDIIILTYGSSVQTSTEEREYKEKQRKGPIVL
ncbi:MAG: hypothetical protein ACP6IS_00135 [Candidatus Asgardarchaeia archaeon]